MNSQTPIAPDLVRIGVAVLILGAVVAVVDSFNRRSAWLMAGVLLLVFLVGQFKLPGASGNWQQFFGLVGGGAPPPAPPRNTVGGGGGSGFGPGGGQAGQGGGGGGGGSF